MKRYQLVYTGSGRWAEKEEKQKQRLPEEVIRHRNSMHYTIPFMLNYTGLCKETHGELVKAMLVVLMMSDRISGDFIFVFAFYELFKMLSIRVDHIIKMQDDFFYGRNIFKKSKCNKGNSNLSINPCLFQICVIMVWFLLWKTHWKSPWCLERLRAEGEDFRGWGSWMASPMQRMWTWANFGRWWGTRRPGMLQSMGSQRVRYNQATEQQWQDSGRLTVRTRDLITISWTEVKKIYSSFGRTRGLHTARSIGSGNSWTVFSVIQNESSLRIFQNWCCYCGQDLKS